MPILTTKLAKFPNYVRRFGVVHGIRLFIGIERDVPAKSAETASFAVPGYGAKIHLRETVSDHAVFWQCSVMEQYEIRRFPQFRRLQQTYEELDRSGQPPIIIDCGANIGLASLWFAKVFPRAKIVAIEPEAGNFEVLKRKRRASWRACHGASGRNLAGERLAQDRQYGFRVGCISRQR